jgi:hypothetical protein
MKIKYQQRFNEQSARMEISFPSTIATLKETANTLSGFFSHEAKVKQTRLSDTLTYLQTRLIQLNSIVDTEYAFGKDITCDIIQYTSRIAEQEAELIERVEYLLSRDHVLADGYIKYEVLYLKEVLQGIRYNCELINTRSGANDNTRMDANDAN